MDADYINPFIFATRDLFLKMIRMPLGTGQPFLKERHLPLYTISAAIEMKGPVSGLAVLSFSTPVALALVSAMTGGAIQQFDRDAMDALGEITNMIAGGAKAKLAGKGKHVVQLSMPKVWLDPAQVPYPPRVPIIAIPCDTGPGRFIIEMALSHTPQHKQAA